MFTWPLIGVNGNSLVGSFSVKVREPMIMPTSDMEKVESLPPADLHFQISALLDFSASTAGLLDTFSMSATKQNNVNTIGLSPHRIVISLLTPYRN